MRPTGPSAKPSLLAGCVLLQWFGWTSELDGRPAPPNPALPLQVGTLAGGFTSNTTGDVIYTNTPLQPDDAPFNRSGPWAGRGGAGQGRGQRNHALTTLSHDDD